jgi:RNA polymerase sigma-70 factor (ECF subfamily)
MMGQAIDDRALLAAIGRGDHSAFEQVYRRYKDDVFTMAVYLLNGDRTVAEDVLQDVMLALARHAGNLQLSTSLKGYLMAACLNRVRDIRRRNRRFENAPSSTALPDPKSADPSSSACLSEQAALLSHALSLLPLEQREVVTLHIYGQMTFREIADSMQVSINTVKSRYRYALSGLRAALTDKKTNEASR